MSKIRLSYLLVSLTLAAGMLIAALPTAPAFALSLPAGTSSVASTSIAAAPSPSAVNSGIRVYVKDRHVTYEYRGDVIIVHVSETIVTERNGKIISERHVSYTYTERTK